MFVDFTREGATEHRLVELVQYLCSVFVDFAMKDDTEHRLIVVVQCLSATCL